MHQLIQIATAASFVPKCRMTNAPFDLRARAHQAMLDAGFHPDFSNDVSRETQTLKSAAPKNTNAIRDLRSLLWSSIDNDSSRDLDQVEFAEKLPDGSLRLLVGIADVDSSVPKGSAHRPSRTNWKPLRFTPAWQPFPCCRTNSPPT